LVQPLPTFALDRELRGASRREGIEARLAAFSVSPTGPEPNRPAPSMKCRIERAFLYSEQIGRGLLDVTGERVAMHFAAGLESPQNKQGERALKDVVVLFVHTYLAA